MYINLCICLCYCISVCGCIEHDDTLSKYITLKKHTITRKLLWYLTISFDISAMLAVACQLFYFFSNGEVDHLRVIWLLSITWFFCFGCQLLLHDDQLFGHRLANKENKETNCFQFIPGLLWGLVFIPQLAVWISSLTYFMMMFFSVLVGIPDTSKNMLWFSKN